MNCSQAQNPTPCITDVSVKNLYYIQISKVGPLVLVQSLIFSRFSSLEANFQVSNEFIRMSDMLCVFELATPPECGRLSGLSEVWSSHNTTFAVYGTCSSDALCNLCPVYPRVCSFQRLHWKHTGCSGYPGEHCQDEPLSHAGGAAGGAHPGESSRKRTRTLWSGSQRQSDGLERAE